MLASIFQFKFLLTNAQNGTFLRSANSGAKSLSVKKLLTGISAITHSFAKIFTNLTNPIFSQQNTFLICFLKDCMRMINYDF